MLDTRSFRQLMGCFATGITVVTANDKKLGGIGLTVNSLTSVSLDPLLVLFCLDKQAHLFEPLSDAHYFAFNILGEEQENISRYFADYRHNPKPNNLWDEPQENCPILRATLGWMVCKKTATYEGGDHTIILGEVVKLHTSEATREPLVYFQGKYRKISK